MFLRILLKIVEFGLYLSLTFLVASGTIVGELNAYPWSVQAAYALPLFLLGLCLVAIVRKTNCSIGVEILAGIAVCAITAINLTSPALTSQFQTRIFFTLIVAVSALIGKDMKSWYVPALFFLGALVLNVFGIDSIPTIEELLSGLQFLIPSIVMFAAAGLVPSVVLLRRTSDASSKITMQPKELTADDIKITTSSQGELVNPSITQSFTIEYSSKGVGDVQNLLSSVVYFMSRNFKAYSSLAFIYEPLSQMFILNSYRSKSMSILKDAQIPLGKGIVGGIGTQMRSFMSGDISLYGSGIHYYSEREMVNSILAVPIIENKELLGVLVLDSKDKNAFRDEDKENLKRFSSLAGALITNSRMRVLQERAAGIFQLFYQASHQFTTALKISEVFDVLFKIFPLATQCSRMMAILFNEERRTGEVFRISGESPDIVEGFQFPINAGLYSYAFQKRRIVTIGDFRQYENKFYRFVPNEARAQYLMSMIIFPIIDDQYRCLGLFSVEGTELNQFSETEQTLATLIENASVAFTRALLYQRMEKLATTDGLTGLNNHRNFQELLANEFERSRRYARPLSLLLMDIDHFKTFNDTYGHPVGDLVLKEISACIRESIRSNDVPARYGGEEFTVIIPETVNENAMVIAERIRKTIEGHVIHSLDRELRVTVSIGCASFPDHVKTSQELIDCADKALYYSKEHGRNQVNLFSAGMNGKSK